MLNKLSFLTEKVQQGFWPSVLSCEVRMVEELPAAVSTLWVKDYHLYHKVELYLIHELK